jgi:hypothetical protein
MLINTVTDLQTAEPSAERTAFLQALLNDFVIFDDAEYPEGYDRELQEGDEGYVAPVPRQEWNAGAAAAWGFDSREQIEQALASQG